MIFIIRTTNGEIATAGIRVVRIRRAVGPLGTTREPGVDLFCVADDDAPERLRAHGWNVVSLHDGWYADDDCGGIAVWGNGRYWEVRDSPFHVIEQG
jgi:hypothetical protein